MHHRSATCQQRLLSKLSNAVVTLSNDRLAVLESEYLNTSIVRLEELDSAGLGLSVAIDECGRTALDSLEQRTDEMRAVFAQINVVHELLQMMEGDFVDAHRQRLGDVLSLCDANARMQRDLKQDPMGTLRRKKHKQK